MYALPVQAVVDSRLKLLYMSCCCSHDAITFEFSVPDTRLKSGEMFPGYWIAVDVAYVSIPGLLTPWSKSALPGEHGVFSDASNFYHSSFGIHVEQAFRVLVNRFEIFWKPVQYHVRDVTSIVSAAMRLHNFCMYHYRTQYITFLSSIEDRSMRQEAFANWWKSATSLRDEANEQRRIRPDLHNHDLCEQLTRKCNNKVLQHRH